MPKEWTMTIIFPIQKKSDKMDCQNYKGISILSVIYKLIEFIPLCGIIKSIINSI